MKSIIKTGIFILLLSFFIGMQMLFARKDKYHIYKPEVIRYNDDKSSWGIIMDVKTDVFKNIEQNWQRKHKHERK